MGSPLLGAPTDRFSRDYFEVFDEFNYFIDADLWTILDADVGSSVAHEGPGRSRVVLTIATTDNNEGAIATTNELFRYVANKPLYCEGIIQYAEVNVNDANVAFGFVDALGANLITDNGAAIAIPDSGAAIYKLDGGTVWRFNTNSAGATAVDSISDTTAGGSAAQRLSIDIQPRSSTVFVARPFVDGVQLKTTAGVPIAHDITIGTSVDMDFGVYVKTGGAQTETVYVDYLYGAQYR